MAKQFDVYKCDTCGVIIEVLHAAAAPLSCCAKPMKAVKEGTSDGAVEKHVPVVEKTPSGIKISVGSTLHPMADDHYIEWIEVINGSRQTIFYLKPGDAPVVEIPCGCDPADIIVREYCNLHGLFKNA